MDKPERLIALTHTNYGFRWGPVEVSRASADPKHGVWLILRSAKPDALPLLRGEQGHGRAIHRAHRI